MKHSRRGYHAAVAQPSQRQQTEKYEPTWTLKIHIMAKWPNEKAEPPPTRGVNRDSGTDSANGGWVSCWELHSEL